MTVGNECEEKSPSAMGSPTSELISFRRLLSVSSTNSIDLSCPSPSFVTSIFEEQASAVSPKNAWLSVMKFKTSREKLYQKVVVKPKLGQHQYEPKHNAKFKKADPKDNGDEITALDEEGEEEEEEAEEQILRATSQATEEWRKARRLINTVAEFRRRLQRGKRSLSDPEIELCN